ncbi:YeeE/YedE family protein [Roseibium algae]|uniref:YeeE/YedE thiosulfate transporter family protein n=1 Tax=Roseibium algae TaxID=3123038 RepID=A0ABU8TRH3_9HYPH
MTEFTPILSMLGGALIGVAVVALMAIQGRIAGITGIVSGLLTSPMSNDWAWRAAFILGMVVAPVGIAIATGNMPQISIPVSPLMLAVGGFIVGVGTSLGSGCTSGHGVCGLARFSARSLVATLIFMATGLATVFIIRHVIGV